MKMIYGKNEPRAFRRIPDQKPAVTFFADDHVLSQLPGTVRPKQAFYLRCGLLTQEIKRY